MLSKMLMVAAAVSVASAELPTKYFNKDLACDNKAICVGGGLDENHLDCVQNEKPIEGRCCIPKCYEEKGLALPKGMRQCVAMENDANSESLGTTTPTNAITATEIHENQRGWRDVRNSRLLRYPESLLGRTALIPSVYTKAGFVFELDCPRTKFFRSGKCDLFVFLYRCPPCQFQNGGDLAANLLANDWLPYTCDVRFKLNPEGYEHNTIVYHKQIERGTFEEVIPTGLLELAWLAKSPATANCGDYESKEMCHGELPGECRWEAGSCNRVLCPKPQKPWTPGLPGGKPKGPWLACTKCVDHERARFLPTLEM